MSDRYEYECALSGVVTEGEILFDEDGLDDMPSGWTELKFSRRLLNPKWVLIQQVKEAMIAGVVLQFPEEVRAGQAVAVQVQVEAQFYAMEQAVPMYLTDVETVFLSPPEASEDVAEALAEVRETLGLDPLHLDEDEEDENEEQEEAEEDSPETTAAALAKAAG